MRVKSVKWRLEIGELRVENESRKRDWRLEIFASLWLVLKGQWGEILLGGNNSIIKENI